MARSHATDPPRLLVAIRDDIPARHDRVGALVRACAGTIAGAADDADLWLVARPAAAAPAGVPLLTYAGIDAAGSLSDLPCPDDQDAFCKALAPWLDRGAAFGRMAALFGDAAMMPMAARLADDLDRLMAGPAIDHADLHKLGGFAGTLGFRRLAHCAERLSLGARSYLPATQREADRASTIVRAYLRNRAKPTTLV